MKFELYEDRAGSWRWRLVAKNGLTVADSGEGYNSEGNVRRAVKMVRKAMGKAKLVVVSPDGKAEQEKDDE